MSSLIIGNLDERSPDRALAVVMGGVGPLAKVIAFPGERTVSGPSPQAPAAGEAFQLKVTLVDTKPPIWRRVLVDGGSTLAQLREVIQAPSAGGTTTSKSSRSGERATAFPIPTRTGASRPEMSGAPALMPSQARARCSGTRTISATVGITGSRSRKCCPRTPRSRPPRASTADAPARPRIVRYVGYREFLGILADPAHPEHDERREWLGRPFDPEAFDPSEFEDNLRNSRLAAFDDEA